MRVSWMAGLASVCIFAGSVIADDASPYDVGYAFAASLKCPNVTFGPAAPAVDVQASDTFKRGTAMFEHYLEMQQIEGAC